MIEAKGLRKQYGDFTAVDGIDFAIEPGEAFGFLGPNGAGKSTTMRMIAATSTRTSGDLRVLGFDEDLIALRLLADRRDELSARRVQTVNRLHRLLTELIPGGAGKDLTATFPELAELEDVIDPQVLAAGETVLDGEIVALDDRDRPSFPRLQQRLGLTRPRDVERARQDVEVHVMLFDLLVRGGDSLLRTPNRERRDALFDVVEPSGHVQLPHADHGDVDHAMREGQPARGQDGRAQRTINAASPPRADQETERRRAGCSSRESATPTAIRTTAISAAPSTAAGRALGGVETLTGPSSAGGRRRPASRGGR